MRRDDPLIDLVHAGLIEANRRAEERDAKGGYMTLREALHFDAAVVAEHLRAKGVTLADSPDPSPH